MRQNPRCMNAEERHLPRSERKCPHCERNKAVRIPWHQRPQLGFTIRAPLKCQNCGHVFVAEPGLMRSVVTLVFGAGFAVCTSAYFVYLPLCDIFGSGVSLRSSILLMVGLTSVAALAGVARIGWRSLRHSWARRGTKRR